MKLYRSYVVRCWQEVGGDVPVWRFALVEIGETEQIRGFAEFSQLVTYLSERLGDVPEGARADEDRVEPRTKIDFTPVSRREF